MIVGQGTFTHAASTFKGNNSATKAESSGYRHKVRRLDGFRACSEQSPATSRTRLSVSASETGRGCRSLIWQGASLVIDEFSRSAYGEVDRPRHPAIELRHHAQGAVFQTADAARLRPWRKPSSTWFPSNCAKPTMGRRCCAAWFYKKVELPLVDAPRSSARSPWSGRMTGSPFVASIEVQSLPASCRLSDTDGSLRIETRATPAILTAYKTRRKYFSVEFHALAEVRTAGGVREIHTRPGGRHRPMVSSPEYSQVRPPKSVIYAAPGVAVKFWPWRSAGSAVLKQLRRSGRLSTGRCGLWRRETDRGTRPRLKPRAGWWGALDSPPPRVTPSSTLRLKAITPSVLDSIGRALCRSVVNRLHVIDVRNGGRVTLTPYCATGLVQGRR